MKKFNQIIFKLLFVILPLTGLAQKKREIALYINGMIQQKTSYSSSNGLGSFEPLNSPALDAGISYIGNANKRLQLQHNFTVGIITDAVGYNYNTPNQSMSVNGDELTHFYSYTPRILYGVGSKKNKLQLVLGLQLRYMAEPRFAGGQTSFGPNTGVLIERIDFATGGFSNPVFNESSFHAAFELGLNRNIDLIKNKLVLKIQPLYQIGLTDAYRGLYRLQEVGQPVQLGSFSSKLNQFGLRIGFGYRF